MKKKNLRRLTAAFLVLAMLFALSGCGAAMTAIEMLQSSDTSSASSSQTASGGSLSDMLSQAQNLGNASSSQTSSSGNTLSGMLPQVQSSSQSSSSVSQVQSGVLVPSTRFDDDPVFVSLRNMMVEFEQDFALALVNFVEGPVGDGYNPVIEEFGYAETCPFMTKCGLIELDGEELYCIIPREKDACVAVYEYDPASSKLGDLLESSIPGEPVLVRCSLSDTNVNYQLCIQSSNGDLLEFERPMLEEGMGMLITRDYFMDFTYYDAIYNDPEGIYPMIFEELLGEWESYGAFNNLGEDMKAYFYFYMDEDGLCKVQYWYGYPDGDIWEHFDGTIVMNNHGLYELTMDLIGGIAWEEGASYTSYMTLGIERASMYEGGINITHIDGNPMIYGTDHCTFYFEPSIGAVG